MADTTRLTLIRHGESMAQQSAVCSGHDTCEGLTDLGRAQAAALRDRLADSGELETAQHLYTSILPRAIETAGVISAALPVGLEAQPECAWCEIHPGDAEGMTWKEIDQKFPPPAGKWDAFAGRLPGGETLAELYVRVGARLRRVASEHEGEHVVVVCHGGVVGASFVALGDVPVQRGWALAIAPRNTSITEWTFGGDEWRLGRYNDAAHLAGVGG